MIKIGLFVSLNSKTINSTESLIRDNIYEIYSEFIGTSAYFINNKGVEYY